MGVEALTVLAIGLMIVLASGTAYLAVRRLRRNNAGDEARLTKLSDALMERLESTSLTPEQKAEIADAIKGMKTERSE